MCGRRSSSTAEGQAAFDPHPDTLPGIGHSQMGIPGPTTFTKGSEIENAETSAIGRAIAALGFSVHRSYASANEISNKTPDSGSATGNPDEDHAAADSPQVATK